MPQNTLLIALFQLSAWLCYAQIWNYPFQFDDHTLLLEAQLPSSWAQLGTHFLNGFFDYGRHFSEASLYLNYLLHGFHTNGYHLVNISLHGFNGFLLWLLLDSATVYFLAAPKTTLKQVFQTYPFWLSLAFVVHPIQVATVSYISQRNMLMVTFFILCSLLCYGKIVISSDNKRKVFGFICLLVFCAFAAIKSKEVGAIVLILIPALELLRIGHHPRIRKVVLLIVIIPLLFFLLSWVNQTAFNLFIQMVKPFGIHWTHFKEFNSSIIPIHSTLLLFYGKLILWPQLTSLSMDHAYEYNAAEINTWMGPAYGIHFVLLVIMLACIRRTWQLREAQFSHAQLPPNSFAHKSKKTDQHPRTTLLALISALMAFGIFSLYLPLLPYFIVKNYEMLVEYKVYISLIGLVCIVYSLGLTFTWLWPKSQVLLKFLLVVIILIFANLTWQRNFIFSTPFHFWKDALQKNPANYRALNNLGYAYSQARTWDLAQLYYFKSLQLKPNYINSMVNLGLNFKAQKKDLEELQTWQIFWATLPTINHNNLNSFITVASIAYYDLLIAKGDAIRAAEVKQGLNPRDYPHFVMAIALREFLKDTQYQIPDLFKQHNHLSKTFTSDIATLLQPMMSSKQGLEKAEQLLPWALNLAPNDDKLLGTLALYGVYKNDLGTICKALGLALQQNSTEPIVHKIKKSLDEQKIVCANPSTDL